MTTATAPDKVDGFDAIGKPIPAARMGAGYRAVKDMVPDITTEDAMTLVGRVADRLERDEPYAALSIATGGAPLDRGVSARVPASDMPPVALDVTGGYRLFAHLLTGPSA